MIKGFQPPPRFDEAPELDHFQWGAAITAGLVAGIILLILPHATPWSGLTLFTPAILGRVPPPAWGMPVFSVVALHLVLSLVYGIIVSLAVVHVHQFKAIIFGGAVCLMLYVLNWAVVTMWIPGLHANEVPVVLTHLVFGLIAAGVYRGLLRRRVPVSP